MSFLTSSQDTYANSSLSNCSTLLKPLSKLLIVCAAAIPFTTTFLHAMSPDEQAVLAPVQAILDGAAQRNAEVMRDQLLPGGMVTLIRNGQPLQLHNDAFIERLLAAVPAMFEEHLHNTVIHIDDDVAVVWSPYTVTVAGKVDHCGTDIVSLIRRNGKWLISNFADNSRKSCGAQ